MTILTMMAISIPATESRQMAKNSNDFETNRKTVGVDVCSMARSRFRSLLENLSVGFNSANTCSNEF